MAGDREISIPTFGCAQGLGALTTGVITGIIFIAQGKLSWSGFGVSMVNCFLVGIVLGLAVGVIYRGLLLHVMVGGAKPVVGFLTAVMLALTLGSGIYVTSLTSRHGGSFIWTWVEDKK